MQPYYKKKRKNTGPNKNEAKVMRSKEVERLGSSGNSLGARFPGVERLVVALQFLSSHQADLGAETRSFGPSDACNFAVPCPGPCGAGDFNLATKIESVITNRAPASEASGKCGQPLFAGSKDLCGCELKCRLTVTYRPLPA
jgi:hypothetical protein